MVRQYRWHFTVILTLLIGLGQSISRGDQLAYGLSSDSFICTVVSSSLYLRSGPGTNYTPPLRTLTQGAELQPLSRNSASTWIGVQVVATSEQGWVSAGARYVACTGKLSTLPVSEAPLSSTVKPPAQPLASAGQPSLITDFERWGPWLRGAENWGTFTQSAEQTHSGQFAGRFEYDFPADVKNNYVVYRQSIAISGQPTALQLWVYGDASSNFLNAWVQDASGQLWQFTFGRINHSGWQQMVAPLDVSLGWPNQPIDGNPNATAVVYPLQFYGFVLKGWREDVALQGTIFVDDLTAVDLAASPNRTATPAPRALPTAGGTRTAEEKPPPLITVPAITLTPTRDTEEMGIEPPPAILVPALTPLKPLTPLSPELLETLEALGTPLVPLTPDATEVPTETPTETPTEEPAEESTEVPEAKWNASLT